MAETLRSRIEHEPPKVKGSRFVGVAAPVADEGQARALLDEARTTWPDASHHCWAWRLARPAIDRAGDDGEPSGSAGRPMLAALTGRDLVDTAVVVVRWFGGTKLGVGGLVRAYGGTAAATLDAAERQRWVATTEVAFSHAPGDTGRVDRALAALGLTARSTWGARVHRRVVVAEAEIDAMWNALADATNGNIEPPADSS